MVRAERGEFRDNQMLSRLCQFWAWLNNGCCVIRDVNSELVPLTPNRIQRHIMARMLLQAACGEPIRIIILKARKGGVSTFVQALFFFMCCHYQHQVAGILAHIADATSEIFEIPKLMAGHYPGARPIQRKILFDDTGSRYWCHTAGSESIGAGGTPNLLHLSEVALWKLNKEDTHYSATNAVPDKPSTIIVEESTARGRELFYNRWENAHADENGYEPVFVPWYFDDRLKARVA